MTTLSVVIPALNEESGIQEIIERVVAVRGALVAAGVERLEVLVVDDGSTDQTPVIVARMDGIRLVRHPVNRGYGAALKTGFAQATGDLLGFLDADGTYPPEYFPQLCAQVLNGADLAVGSRMSGAASSMPFLRRVGNVFFATLISVIGRQRVNDSASGMRVFKRSVLERILPLPDGLNLTPVMSTRAIHEGVSMVEVPIPYDERVGDSKLNVVRDGSIFLRSVVWTVMTYNPVRILGLLGLAGLALATLVGAGLVYARMMGVTELGPWGVAAVFGALVAAVTGISLFALGTTFNYLVSLFYRRPVRQGLFGRPIFPLPLDRHFGWMGLVCGLAGGVLGLISVALGLQGWDVDRLWLYLLISAMAILMGVQLTTFWVLVRVLDELSQRAILVEPDPVA
ncbi:MAG TPA: glycosyltransferase family 2 protein [Anaerolineales bacterium]|jgi:hypothetical protein